MAGDLMGVNDVGVARVERQRCSQPAVVAHEGINRLLLSWACGSGLGAMGAFEQDTGCVNVLDFDMTAAGEIGSTDPANPNMCGSSGSASAASKTTTSLPSLGASPSGTGTSSVDRDLLQPHMSAYCRL